MKHYRSRSNLRRSRKPKSRNNRRRRTYRYRGGAAGGVAAQIAAVDVAFNAAVGGMGNTVTYIKTAVQTAARGCSSSEAKAHAATLIGSLSHYDKDRVVTAVMLAADLAATTATKDATRTSYLERNVFGPQPRLFDNPVNHDLADSKSQPTKPASPKRPH